MIFGIIGSAYASSNTDTSMELQMYNFDAVSAEQSDIEPYKAKLNALAWLYELATLAVDYGADAYKAYDSEMEDRQQNLEQVRERMGDVPPDSVINPEFNNKFDVIFDQQ
jgi:hypothetical protein